MPGKTNQKDQHQQQDREIRAKLKRIKNKILVMSGKGGVGKSSIAAYLAVALTGRGFRVGLMDIDLHGPSIPRLLGLKGVIGPATREGKARAVPYRANMEVISIESLMGENKDAATIWRGPLKIGVIRQFIADIEWEDLDYMIIDSPPGTGDEPLTVAQTIPDARALIVTTPQEISLADVRKSINFCRQVQMKILGLVENMSGLVCPHCGKTVDVFKTKGGLLTAEKEGLTLLGTLPIDPRVVVNGDIGDMGLLEQPDLPFAKEFNKIVDAVIRLSDAQATAAFDADKNVPARKKTSRDAKIIVVPLSGGKLSPHFGHCEQFAFIEARGRRIVGTEMRSPPPHEPGVLPRWLHEQGADVVLVGGLGEKAQELLRDKGIEVVIGAPAEAPEYLARQYLEGILVSGANICDH
jgi:Mrp family chromosome partitioning ATPase/predicted Fe-Mo cluster-binding NifX family protein